MSCSINIQGQETLLALKIEEKSYVGKSIQDTNTVKVHIYALFNFRLNLSLNLTYIYTYILSELLLFDNYLIQKTKLVSYL